MNKNKLKTGFLDTAGLNRDNVRANIVWDRSVIGDCDKNGRAVNQVLDAVCAGFRHYAAQDSKDLQDDLVWTVNESLPNWSGGNWGVVAGFHMKMLYDRTWYLDFEFKTKNNFRIMCAWNAAD